MYVYMYVCMYVCIRLGLDRREGRHAGGDAENLRYHVTLNKPYLVHTYITYIHTYTVVLLAYAH